MERRPISLLLKQPVCRKQLELPTLRKTLYVGHIEWWHPPPLFLNHWLANYKSFVGKVKSFVGKDKSLVGKDKSFVGKDKSFVGKDKSFVGKP